MLEVRGVSKAFGPTQALSSVSFKAQPGKVLGVVGENGSGKSTLMRILTGELPADSGSVLIDGHPHYPRSDQVFLVHQELALCQHMTVAENIFLGRLGKVACSKKLIESRSREILDQLGYPDLAPDTLVAGLPISLCQVVEIARSQARNSPIVLFDEPTSSLTQHDIEKLFQLIRRMRDQGHTILLISHFLEEVREIADQVMVLRDGELVVEGEITAFSDEELITHMVGRRVTDLFPRSARTRGEILLDISDVTGSKNKPKGSSLQLHRGEVLGIAGLNGAGRTELMRCIMKLDPVRAGAVKVHDYSPKNVTDSWRHSMGMVCEDRKREGLATQLSIAENLTMPSRKGFRNRPKATAERAERWASELNIRCTSVEQPVSSLSGGNQQRVAVARLLDAGCDVLLLDEPTRGVDIGSKSEIYRLIDSLALAGSAVLIVSSYLPELLGICDRIGVMNRGVLSDFIDAKQATAERLMEMCVR